jgi:hypothetical protein
MFFPILIGFCQRSKKARQRCRRRAFVSFDLSGRYIRPWQSAGMDMS